MMGASRITAMMKIIKTTEVSIQVAAATVLENGVHLMDPQPPAPNAHAVKAEPTGRSESTRVSFLG
jgi:hypothetical protein